MGTGASSYTPPPTPFRTLRSSTISRGFDDPGFICENTVTKMSNRVAPVIIKNCMEEYQHVSDFTHPVVYGSMADKMTQHVLIQGEYFLIRDHNLQDHEEHSPVPVQRAKGDVPVYWCGQPTAVELKGMVRKLEDDGYPEILLFNMREEPVLFVKQGNDFIPYTITKRDRLKEAIVTGKVVKEADLFEASIRREVICRATLNDENRFCFYNDTETLTNEPHIYPVEFEDNLLVAEEVYDRLAFSNPILRYRRLCFPLDGAPPDLEVDHFISVAQDCELMISDSAQPAMLFTCQSGSGRANVGAIMGYLLLTYKHHNQASKCSSGPEKRKSESELLEHGNFNAIRKLVKILPNGHTLKYQVDCAIDSCCTSHHLRKEIVEAQKKLASMQSNRLCSDSDRCIQYDKCVNYLTRYFFLICFNAYLAQQYEKKFKVGFTRWMNRHPEVNHLRSTMCLPVYNTSYDLLTSGQHCLVSDNYVGLDLLGSQMDVRVANFRKINVKGLPVYGMAQPANDGISKVVNHLLNTKVKHTHVVVVNLRNDLMVEIDDSTYSVRDKSRKDEPIIFPGLSKLELEDKEQELKRIIRKHKTFQIYNELSDPPLERDILNAYTILDLADNQRLQTLDMTYYRLPLLSDESPSEGNIDRLMEVVCKHCRPEKLKNNTDTAFVFFCRTGKSRSTFAMAVAGLILCHIKGFPYGSQPGEQERISLPNAQYTKGEFIIVQKLVRMLPNGHQVKREVDFILDEIFNTMTPMMFHMREIIFVTYNKVKRCQTEAEHERIMCLSILFLERYVHLILFNAYLHSDRSSHWQRPFSQWMKEVGARSGVYELLDNLGFYDFEDTLSETRRMSIRWKHNVPNVPWQGEFL